MSVNYLTRPMPLVLLISCFVVPTIVGCGSARVQVPEAFAKWNSKDGTFAMEYPENWDADGNGSRSRGIAWALFNDGPVRVRIDVSFADSLAIGGQASRSNQFGDEFIEPVPPEDIIQEKHRSWFEENFSDFEEDEGESKRLQLGGARINRFSGKNGMVKTKGIRATIMTNDRSVSYVAQCPASYWEDFEPVFVRMLDGMSRGTEELGP